MTTQKRQQNIIFNLLFGIILTISLIAPDYIMRLFSNANRAGFDIEFIIAIFVFGTTISMVRGKKLFYFSMIAFFIMQSIQIPFMTYFGRPINPIEITRAILDADEVLETGAQRIFDMWWILPMLLLSFGVPIYVYRKVYTRFTKVKFIIIVPVLMLLFYPKIAFRKAPGKFNNVSPVLYSLHCSMDSFSYTLFNVMWADLKTVKVKDYLPYKIKKIKSATPANNVILVMGESSTSNHMSLYGYKRKTKPNMDRLAKQYPNNFAYKQGISCSISTVTSIPMFFNLMREPGNLKHIDNKTTNLFRLAKENGYKTFWISAQHSKFMHEVGAKYIDVVITNNNQHRINFETKGDGALVDYLKKLELGKKNFIVLHQRSAHTPYQTNYAYRRDEFEKFPTTNTKNIKESEVNAYDNSILFNDFIWKSVIEFAKSRLDGNTDVFITSDHAELFGEKGLNGHHHLIKECTKVPFIFFTTDKNGSVKKELTNIPKELSHYEIGKLIINSLGLDVNNPNEKCDDCDGYIHSNNMYIDYKFLPLKRNKNTGILETSEKAKHVSDIK